MTPNLVVWPSRQRAAVGWSDPGFSSAVTRDVACVPQNLAAYAIRRYTRPGDTVLDPDCGAGAVLVEAVRAGRHAIGATASPRCWAVARGNVSRAKEAGAVADGTVLEAVPQAADSSVLDVYTGHVELVLATLRPEGSGGSGSAQHRWRPKAGVPTEAEVAATGQAFRLLRWCRPAVCPSGVVVVAVPPRRGRGELLDLPACIVTAGSAAGLRVEEYAVALTARLRGERRSFPPAAGSRRRATRGARSLGRPISLTAHWDVVVFRAPDSASPALEAPLPLSVPELALEAELFAAHHEAVRAA